MTVVALGAAGVASGVPEPPNAPVAQAAERSATALSAGGVAVSLESSSPAIAAGDPFGFTTRVRVDSPISYLQVRLKVYRPTGRLIFQRTRIENRVQPGIREFHFERETDDLDLRPGAYPVEVQVTIEGPDGKLEDVVTGDLRIYDPAAGPTDLVMVAHLTGAPQAGPDGRFIEDPGRDTGTLAELERLVSAAETTDIPITLSIPPMLLEEWKRISAGYEIAGPEGAIAISASDPTPRRHALVLERLADAMKGGRVELLSTGYSDPDLSELAANRLRGDVGVQYARGLSATFASLESTPSTGSAPAGGCVPPAAVARLADAELGYVIVEARCVRRGETTVTAGIYQAADTPLAVLVADANAGETAALGDINATTSRAFARHGSRARAPFVFVADIGPAGRGTSEGFLRTASALSGLPWLDAKLARDVVRTGGTRVTLVSAAPDRSVPDGFWDDVVSGRRWAEALAWSAGDGQADTIAAQTASLIAESSVWSRAEWALAQRGRSFADAARGAGRRALDPVTLSLEPITLSGTDGAVPVTVSNGSDSSLRVRIRAVPSGNLRLTGDAEQELALKPQENFFEVPVALQNAVTGQLTVSVTAGDVLLERKTVTVRASYLDRLAIIGGVVVLLGGLLAYIIRRVTRAEAADGESHGDGRYTDATLDPPSGRADR